MGPRASIRTRSGALALLPVAIFLVVQGCQASPPPPAPATSAPAGAGAGAPPAEATAAPPEAAPEGDPQAPHVEAAVTIHPEATRAAMDVLADGGSAADAAVAAAAVLSVVEPYFSHVLGGETSALYRDAQSGRVQSLDAAGDVGSTYDRAGYTERGASGYGLYQSLVPGAWDGWMVLLAEHGELGLDRLLEPAIELARDGHPATAAMEQWVAQSVENGAINEAGRAIYTPDGQPLVEGDTVVQEQLADTLQQISAVYTDAGDRRGGLQAARDLVYRGELAERILQAVQDDGGYLTADDLADFRATLTDSVSLDWDEEVTVHQNPPPSQGLTMLLALNTLRDAELADDPDDPAVVHSEIEAMKLAMADRERFVGDPDFTEAPVEELLSPEYGRDQLARIEADRSLAWPIADGVSERNTTTFQVVDAEGDAVAATTSIGAQLTVAGDTGITLNNRMRFMNAEDEDSANYLEPGKQVRYTGNPWMATRGDRLWLLGGIVGVDTQPQVQTQNFLDVVEFGMSPQQAMAEPRWVSTHFPDSVAPHEVSNRVDLEEGVPAEVVDGLRARGQDAAITGSGLFGAGSIVELSADGTGAELGTEPRVPTSTGELRRP